MNILTFDLEDWYHLLGHPETKGVEEWARYSSRLIENTDRLLAILADRDLKATFFSLGWVARNYPEVIRAIDQCGHEIACHSDRHQLATSQSRSEFEHDLRDSIHSLEDVTGRKVRAYRAPGFSVTSQNLWVFDALVNQGIEVDCSLFPMRKSTGGFPETPSGPSWLTRQGNWIKVFPVSAYRVFGRSVVFSGGAYFRIIPYWLIRRLMRRSKYVMTYFHPRDFDANQPVIASLSKRRRMITYYGLQSARGKLERMLDEFDFISLCSAEAQVDWSSAPVLLA
jgi:polysaccharide deacetylase family protein (PEP-CTERM system associated)